MAAFLKKYRATVGAAGSEREYFFLQSATGYGGSVDTVTGITAATDTEQDEPETSVASLLRSGKLFRVNIRYTGGPTGFRSAKILVTRQKLGTALDELVGKSYRGGQIVRASIPRKATYI